MPKLRVLGPAIVVGMTLALALSSTAAAYELISESGNHGEWGTASSTVDDPNKPGAKCGYSAPEAGIAHLAWIKVFPFKALAFNRTGAVDQQSVKFKVTVQSSTNGGTTWKNGASTSQTRTARDNKSADFSTLKVNASGKAGSLYRAIVTLQWLRNGQVDGQVKVRMEYYGVKWTVGSPSFIYTDACDGAAD